MERQPLSSTVVRSAGYDESQLQLELEFSSGRVYRFEGVPRRVFDWLLRTKSKGSYVARMINGHYPYHEVTEPAAAATADLAQALRDSLSRPDE